MYKVWAWGGSGWKPGLLKEYHSNEAKYMYQVPSMYRCKRWIQSNDPGAKVEAGTSSLEGFSPRARAISDQKHICPQSPTNTHTPRALTTNARTHARKQTNKPADSPLGPLNRRHGGVENQSGALRMLCPESMCKGPTIPVETSCYCCCGLAAYMVPRTSTASPSRGDLGGPGRPGTATVAIQGWPRPAPEADTVRCRPAV